MLWDETRESEWKETSRDPLVTGSQTWVSEILLNYGFFCIKKRRQRKHIHTHTYSSGTQTHTDGLAFHPYLLTQSVSNTWGDTLRRSICFYFQSFHFDPMSARKKTDDTCCFIFVLPRRKKGRHLYPLLPFHLNWHDCPWQSHSGHVIKAYCLIACETQEVTDSE